MKSGLTLNFNAVGAEKAKPMKKSSKKPESMKGGNKPNSMPNDMDEENEPQNAAGAPDEYAEHEINDALHHLTKAEEIKQNKGLMKALQPHIAKKVQAIRSLDDLRMKAKEMNGSDRVED